MTTTAIIKARKETVKTINVSELKNIGRILAEKNLEHNGVYFCFYNNEKVEVVK